MTRRSSVRGLPQPRGPSTKTERKFLNMTPELETSTEAVAAELGWTWTGWVTAVLEAAVEAHRAGAGVEAKSSKGSTR